MFFLVYWRFFWKNISKFKFFENYRIFQLEVQFPPKNFGNAKIFFISIYVQKNHKTFNLVWKNSKLQQLFHKNPNRLVSTFLQDHQCASPTKFSFEIFLLVEDPSIVTSLILLLASEILLARNVKAFFGEKFTDNLTSPLLPHLSDAYALFLDKNLIYQVDQKMLLVLTFVNIRTHIFRKAPINFFHPGPTSQSTLFYLCQPISQTIKFFGCLSFH